MGSGVKHATIRAARKDSFIFQTVKSKESLPRLASQPVRWHFKIYKTLSSVYIFIVVFRIVRWRIEVVVLKGGQVSSEPTAAKPLAAMVEF